MAQAKGKGCGSAVGCVVVLGVLGFVGWRYGPQILAAVRGQSAALDWGKAHEEEGLRLRILSAGVETTDVEDVLGSREGSLDLHLTLEITNTGSSALTYRTPRILRASEPKLTDDRGRNVTHVTYGDGAKVDGQLSDNDRIEPRESERHDLLFKLPAPGALSFLLNFDLALLGKRGVVQFRIPAAEIKGLK